METKKLSAEIRARFSLRQEKFLADGYLFVEIEPQELAAFAVFARKELGFGHLASIACTDYIKEGKFALAYNFFSYSRRVLLSVKVKISRAAAEFESISHIYYAARFFERDIYEMFGINFKGNSYQKKFILDEWQGPPPMRKDFDTRSYVDEHFSWRLYQPRWAKDLGLRPEDLKGEDLELL